MKYWHCVLISAALEAVAGAVMVYGFHQKAKRAESAAWDRAVADVEKAKSADAV